MLSGYAPKPEYQHHKLAPVWNWGEVWESDHLVQFYDTDQFLLNSLSSFVDSSLQEGHACVVVATPEHREGLNELLRFKRPDIFASQMSGRFVMLDAAETLGKLMGKNSPDPQRFVEVIGGLLEKTSAGGRSLRVFGEMVALLWADGNYNGAIELEQLWNELQKIRPFCLFCAYPMGKLGGEALVDPLTSVCASHTKVVPTESYATLTESQDRLREIILLQQKAESLELQIAARARTEERLRASEIRYRRLFEASSDGILLVDATTGKITDANCSLCELSGLGREELLGKELWEIGLYADRNSSEQTFRQLQDHGVVREPHAVLRSRDGRACDVELVTSVYNANGEDIIQCNIRDITPRVKAESDLFAVTNKLLLHEQAARQDAEKANRIKDDFLATVSHELRTPLNSMMGWTRLLQSPNADPELYTRAVQSIERGIKVQAQVIEDLLDVSRIISGKLRLDMVSIEVESLLASAIDAIRPAADAKNISLYFHSDITPSRVNGDAARLQQVIWNLLSNSIKFTPAGGQVEIRITRNNGYLEIAVSDSGEGISPDFLPYVFERFRQADGTSTRNHGGLGLGLAIVSHLVQLHKGSVSAESPGEGKGATFRIQLPWNSQSL